MLTYAVRRFLPAIAVQRRIVLHAVRRKMRGYDVGGSTVLFCDGVL